MLQLLKDMLHRRVERLKSTDFGSLEESEQAESKSRDAHDSLMDELKKLQELLQNNGHLH